MFSLVVPAWMVVTMSGWARTAAASGLGRVVSGGTFAVVQFFVSNYLGPTLTDVAGGLLSLAVLSVMLRFWQPRGDLAAFPEERELEMHPAAALTTKKYSRGELVKAWGPWIILSVCVFLWGLPQFSRLSRWGNAFPCAAHYKYFQHVSVRTNVGAGLAGNAKTF